MSNYFGTIQYDEVKDNFIYKPVSLFVIKKAKGMFTRNNSIHIKNIESEER